MSAETSERKRYFLTLTTKSHHYSNTQLLICWSKVKQNFFNFLIGLIEMPISLWRRFMPTIKWSFFFHARQVATNENYAHNNISDHIGIERSRWQSWLHINRESENGARGSRYAAHFCGEATYHAAHQYNRSNLRVIGTRCPCKKLFKSFGKIGAWKYLDLTPILTSTSWIRSSNSMTNQNLGVLPALEEGLYCVCLCQT